MRDQKQQVGEGGGAYMTPGTNRVKERKFFLYLTKHFCLYEITGI